MFHDRRVKNALSILLIVFAIIAVVLLGIVGYGRSGYLQQTIHLLDAKYFYLAGRAWLEGLNPYDPAIACKVLAEACKFQDYSFAYPPSSAPFLMLLALLDLRNAQIVFILANIICLILFVCTSVRILSASIGNQHFITDIRKSLFIAMAIGNVAVANTLWMGQTSIIISTFIVLSFYFYAQSQDMRSGLFLALALMKPQLSYPFLFWLLLEGKWKILTACLAVSISLLMIPISIRGMGPTISEWLAGLGHYVSQPANKMGNFTLSSACKLLNVMGLHVNTALVVILISLLVIICIHKYYKDVRVDHLLGMLSVMSLLFGQAHHYDLVLAVIVLLYFLSRVTETDYWSLFYIILLFVIFNLPRQAFLLKFDHWIMNSHREIILFVVFLFMLRKKRVDARKIFSKRTV